MARPKGIIQKRDESKYILPEGVSLKPGQTEVYNKSTRLIFIDPEFGEFESTFRANIDAGASAHPKAVQRRREATNHKLYGGPNPSSSKEIRKKAEDTMEKKYGVRAALKSPEFLKKSQETLKRNYGVETPMGSDTIKQRIKDNNKAKWGVENPMQVEEIKERLKQSNLQKYGVENPGGLPESLEKTFKSRIENGSTARSKGEIEIQRFVESFGIACKSWYIGGANPKQIDIKINSLNLGIEFNGVYWHSEGNPAIHKNYHLEKTEEAKKHGLDLIHIFDFEWEERQEQVKSFLQSKLGMNTIKYNARSLDLREVPKEEAKKFLNDYHILGYTRFIKGYGLYNNEELVALITVGKHHRNNTEIVLNRYVGKTNVTVRGGLSRLSKAAVKDFGEITTWVDRRFSNGDGWLACGWELVSILPPDYFYFDKRKHKIVSKQARQKSAVNTPSGMTEHEHAKLDGLYRVYDCGKIKLKIK